ncbi:hypothetical protein [Nocardia suismassiliense]|uniref:hypothetical protein n=1 Tax=Nocardia suismassiliense TaxID=2077092 RepID=UPI000D1E0752|nr:hypothetical protein [Nocardia suismassiliense]
MEIWEHGGNLYEVSSYYCLTDDAWIYALQGITGPPGTGPHLDVSIADETPDEGLFVPKSQRDVVVSFGPGSIPWLVLRRFRDYVQASGDIFAKNQSAEVVGDIRRTNNAWHYGDQRFEVNSFYFSDRDAWCYELCVPDPDPNANHYLDVIVPDRTPNGPFTPATVDRVVLTPHGEMNLPWPLLTHFMRALESAEDIAT